MEDDAERDTKDKNKMTDSIWTSTTFVRCKPTVVDLIASTDARRRIIFSRQSKRGDGQMA